MQVVKGTCLLLVCMQVSFSYGKDYFNPLFLGEDVASLDNLAYIADGNTISPGSYYFDLYLGDTFIKNIHINFVEQVGTQKVVACLTKNIVELIPFNEVTKKELFSQQKLNDGCIAVDNYIPDFGYQIDLSKAALKLSIPQIYLQSVQSTLAEQSDWDDGINAFLMNYDFSGSNAYNKNSDNYSSNYLSLNNRLNIGAWRLHGNIYWNQNTYGAKTYNESQTSNVYLSRDVNALRSNLVFGQQSLGSNLFDTMPYIGLTLATANDMLPESQRGYSPPIKGIAESRSKLTIRQNNTIIYQTYVDPGPYDISDLNPVGSSGDYEVELTSVNGIVTRYTVPYSTLPNLLKSGNYNYAATIGQLDISDIKKIKFTQGSVSIGLPWYITAYAGVQYSTDYKALGVGIAKDIGNWGALSLDMINAKAEINNQTKIGQSYRVLYAKNFTETGTNIQLSGYRYSTSDYYSFTEASYKRGKEYFDSLTGQYVDTSLLGRKKNTFQINISQNLGQFGQLSAWGNSTSYWGSKSSRSLQIGWNKSYPELNNLMVSLNYNKYIYANSKNDIFYLSFSMPLSGRTSNYNMYLSNSSNYNISDHSYNNNTSIYGNGLDNRLDYNIYQSLNKDSTSNTTQVNASYKADEARLKLGMMYSPNTTQVDYGISGAVFVHSDGVVFTREANDTAILVKATGAEGAKVNRAGDNITVNKQGYALVPYATPYHYNDVELDPVTFADNYDVDNKVIKVAPTRGAISKVIFDVRKGYNFLAQVNYKGKSIPFGTIIKNLDDSNVAIANDDGSVYLTGVQDHAKFSVSWDKQAACTFVINYDDNFVPQLVNKINVNCLEEDKTSE